MARTRWTTRVRTAAAVGLVAAFAVAGCSSSSETSTEATAGTTAVTAAGTTAGTAMTDEGATAGTTAGTAMMDEGTTVHVVETDFGPALAVGDEQVVYTWDRETGSTPVCTHDLVGPDGQPCDEKWPVVEVASLDDVAFDGVDAALFTVVARPDGRSQLAVDGRLLYTMALDGPGEANCQAAEGWYIVNADGTSNRAAEPV